MRVRLHGSRHCEAIKRRRRVKHLSATRAAVSGMLDRAYHFGVEAAFWIAEHCDFRSQNLLQRCLAVANFVHEFFGTNLSENRVGNRVGADLETSCGESTKISWTEEWIVT